MTILHQPYSEVRNMPMAVIMDMLKIHEKINSKSESLSHKKHSLKTGVSENEETYLAEAIERSKKVWDTD